LLEAFITGCHCLLPMPTIRCLAMLAAACRAAVAARPRRAGLSFLLAVLHLHLIYRCYSHAKER
jgi:hypothetical protein